MLSIYLEDKRQRKEQRHSPVSPALSDSHVLLAMMLFGAFGTSDHRGERSDATEEEEL